MTRTTIVPVHDSASLIVSAEEWYGRSVPAYPIYFRRIEDGVEMLRRHQEGQRVSWDWVSFPTGRRAVNVPSRFDTAQEAVEHSVITQKTSVEVFDLGGEGSPLEQFRNWLGEVLSHG